MNDKITQFKMFYDFDKEVEYINKMNQQGWKLVYIKVGCFYTFVKTEPDEYVTILYADDKENISSVAIFAAQCGYENIPHSADGVGDIMYLTGKKSEVSSEFVSDIDSKLKLSKKMVGKYNLFMILHLILLGVLLMELAFLGFIMWISRESLDWVDVIFPLSFTAVLMVVVLVMFAVVIRARSSAKKKYKALLAEQNLYE